MCVWGGGCECVGSVNVCACVCVCVHEGCSLCRCRRRMGRLMSSTLTLQHMLRVINRSASDFT